MSRRDTYLSGLPRSEAQRLWRDKLAAAGYFAALPAEQTPVTTALGRVTAACVYARRSVPHYNSAAMDGIAVRARDTFGAAETAPRRLKLLSRQAPFQPGGCYPVNTGEVLPDGTDAVIMIEDVHIAGDEAVLLAAARPWQHVRIIGEDIVAGEMVLSEHHVIAPADIAALLAAGLTTVPVIVRPRVLVIPTGSEVVDQADDLAPGKILDVNSHMLCAAVQEWGGVAVRHGVVPDEPAALRQAVQDGLAQADMVVTIAGTAVGSADYTARVLGELGTVLVHGVAIRPGKPVVLALCQGKPVIGLPGYPVSALLAAELFMRDVLLARQGRAPARRPTVAAVLARKLHADVGSEEYVRVSLGNLHGKKVAVPLARGAGLISSLTRAQGLVAVPAHRSGLPAGEQVPVILLAPEQDTLLCIGSHDLALDILGAFLRRRMGVQLSCANVGSMGGITAVLRDEAHLAGIHLLDTATGEYNVAYVEKYLPHKTWCLVHLARRQQGLMVAPGNPKNITGLADLARTEVVFINRQRGSGTRTLLDYHLTRLGLAGAAIVGYDKEVATHMAVAASVAAGAADAGLGIRAAAAALGLAFIPVAQEQYDLLLNMSPTDAMAQEIISILSSPDFRRQVEDLGGYDLAAAGQMIAAHGGADMVAGAPEGVPTTLQDKKEVDGE